MSVTAKAAVVATIASVEFSLYYDDRVATARLLYSPPGATVGKFFIEVEIQLFEFC